MYLLAHLAYRLLPSYRWMDLVPTAVLYAGLAVFLISIVPLFVRTRARQTFLLFATLSPQLLMWGNTFRWYSWWTGVALIALTVALQPARQHATLTATRALSLGVLLAALFYLNYITLIFVAALAAAAFVRYRAEVPARTLLIRALLALGVFLALIAPQLHTMFAVHLPDARAQRYSLLISCLRLIQSIATSEAYLPWHPLAIAAVVVSLALCLIACLRLARSREAPQTEDNSPLRAICVFGMLFFLLVAASGLGGKPRSALLLIPVLAVPLALLADTLRPRTQTALLAFLALWSAVGAAHLLTRTGLSKSSMTDRPEQVATFVHHSTTVASQAAPASCAVVVTYDSALAFALAESHTPNLLIVSPFRGAIFGGAPTLPDTCASTRLFVVQSYLAGNPTRLSTFNGELAVARQYILGPPRTDRFSPDADAPSKRRLARLLADPDAATLPDARYTVTSGPMDPAALDVMRHRLTHFVSGYDVAPAP
jgi:hypothetical protein